MDIIYTLQNVKGGMKSGCEVQCLPGGGSPPSATRCCAMEKKSPRDLWSFHRMRTTGFNLSLCSTILLWGSNKSLFCLDPHLYRKDKEVLLSSGFFIWLKETYVRMLLLVFLCLVPSISSGKIVMKPNFVCILYLLMAPNFIQNEDQITMVC